MKKKIFLLITVLISIIDIKIFAQGNCELLIENRNIDYFLYVRMYPVSMVFNGAREGNEYRSGYNLVARKRYHDPTPPYTTVDFINSLYIQYGQLIRIMRLNKYGQGGNIFCLQHDAEDLMGSAIALFGFGKYRIDFFWSTTEITNENDISELPTTYCTIDIDAGYGIGGPAWYDLGIFWYNENDIRCNIGGFCDNTPIPPEGNIQVWNICESHKRLRDPGNFKYDAGTTNTENPYEVLPQDPRIHCAAPWLPVPYQNHDFEINNVGLLTLNLTIEKNSPIGNPIEIKTLTEEIGYGAVPIIISDGATLKLAKGTNNLERKLTFKKYPCCNLNTNLIIEEDGTFILEGAANSSTRSYIYMENFSYTRVDPGGTLNLGTYSLLEMQNYCGSEIYNDGRLMLNAYSTLEMHGNNTAMIWLPRSIIVFPSNTGKIKVTDGARLTNCGALIIGTKIIEATNNGKYVIRNDCGVPFENFSGTIDSGGHITLSEYSELSLCDGYQLIFDGPESFLQVSSGSTVELGEGASIEFRNGAYLAADNSTFSGNSWNGIKFTDAGPSTIQNCSFSGASTYLDFENTTSGNAANNITITGNTFTNGNVKIENTTNCLISSNTFNSAGLVINLVDISNNINLQPDSWSLNITGNQFTGGLTQIKLTGLAGNVSPFYVNANTFNGGANMGLWGTNISGSFKNNNYTSADYYASYDVIGSDMDVYNNALYSNDNVNVHAVTSNVKLAPVLNENNELVWFGGLNELTSANSDNIYFSIGSDAIVNDGNNCFTVQDQNYFHINGSYSPCFNPLYNAVRNLWNTDPPLVNVLCDGFPSSVTYTPTAMSCLNSPPAELSLVGYNIADMGNGIIDTVIITTNYGSGLGGGNSGNVKEINSPPVISEDKIL